MNATPEGASTPTHDRRSTPGGGIVYAVVGPRLYVFDASTGTRFFMDSLDGWVQVSPSVANGVVYVDSERALFAFGL